MSTMAQEDRACVALLRGINVGGKHKLPMAELRSVLAKAGCSSVRTYIQSGNVVLRSNFPTAELGDHLRRVIEDRLGFATPVMVRSSAEWSRYVDSNPFSVEASENAGHVLLVLSEDAPDPSAPAELASAATLGERVELRGDAIWIHFAGGIARSKLSSALLDRRIGSPTTARNWRTVLKLQDLAGEVAVGG